jgi:hypothetical protein
MAAPTARIALLGGLMIALNVLHAEHAEIGDGERRVRHVVQREAARPRLLRQALRVSLEIVRRLF